MSTIQRPFVVGVFKNEEKAKRALDMLRDEGLNDDQISIAVPGRGLMAQSILGNLVDVSLPEEEVNYYAREFEAGRSIVWVRHDGRQLEVASILIQCGTRIHEYFKISKADGVSPNERRENQYEGLQGSSSSTSSNKPSSLIVEETTADEMPPWMKILKDAGFDHLI